MLSGSPPVASPDQYQVVHDETLYAGSVLGNDYDYESDPLTASVVSGPGHAASFVFNSDGTFTYTPITLWVGTDSFTYEASDGTGAAQATVSIEVTNQAPYAGDDSYALAHNASISDSVLSNDTDYDGDALSVTLVSGPSYDDSFYLYSDGDFSYTPLITYQGTDSFVYEISDGIDTATATVTLTVNNTAPVATGLNDVNVNVNSANTVVDASAGFYDQEDANSDLTFSVTGNTEPSLFDSVTIDAQGQLTLDYAADAPGESQITVTATDTGGLSTDTIFTVHVNAAPILTSFTSAQVAGLWEFSGYADDDADLTELTVALGGALSVMVSVDSSGYFEYTTEEIGEQENISAQATDQGGLTSNIRWTLT